jgi:peptidoglycan/xylan/chitin deacetylase (PgdA/CDA1 family)
MVRRRTAVLALLGGALLFVGACGGARQATWHAPMSHPVPANGQGGGTGADASPATGSRPGQPQPNGEHKPHTVGQSGSTPPSAGASTGPTFGPAVPGVIRKTGSSSVALTFDDGPGEGTNQILALLRQYHVKATFCLIGVNVQAHPDLVQAIVKDGHTLCNHTWKHDEHLGQKSADTIRDDLQRTNDAIHAAAPDAPIKYFRHPGGNFTPLAVDVAKELGMASLGWNVDPKDWDLHGRWAPGPALTQHVISVVEHNTHAGSIVLSHDGGGDRQSTVEAYRTLMPYLTGRFTLVSLPT